MLRVVMVEDTPAEADLLRTHLERYANEHGIELQVVWLRAALDFIEGAPQADLIFMDIDMPGINGMEAAQALRLRDSSTPLVFVTNLAQYAVRGYEVDALDFMVKPVSYPDFRLRMDRAMRAVTLNATRSITVRSHKGIQVFPAEELLYVDMSGHDAVYHLAGGESLTVRDSLKRIEGELAGLPFVRLSSGVLANMAHVRRVSRDEVRLSDGTTLYFSRAKKKEAQARIASYLGGGFA